MKTAIEQSIKEKIKALAKERGATFAELWRTLILERFLIRLSLSTYREKFIFKGGTLLAKYLPLGRETQDLDFLVQKLTNSESSLKSALHAICQIDAHDSFLFEVGKIRILDHVHLPYTGAEITIVATFGATRTVMRIDLGFGDRTEPIDFSIDLTASNKGVLFEKRVSLRCYPKEFIFAEKLETVVFRGASNTRMKDFHDLYSLIHLGNLDASLTDKAIRLVFNHRKTDLRNLPVAFEGSILDALEKNWMLYRKKIKPKKDSVRLPESLDDLILNLNQWLKMAIT